MLSRLKAPFYNAQRIRFHAYQLAGLNWPEKAEDAVLDRDFQGEKRGIAESHFQISNQNTIAWISKRSGKECIRT